MNEKLLNIALNSVKVDKISVIPVSKTKIPLIKWAEFQTRFATEDEIKSWFKSFPDMQLGFITGPLSNLTVVDVEVGGDPSFLPQETFIVQTGSKGFHYYYRYQEGLQNKARIKPLIDIRGLGGYVVSPGSVSDKGPYTVLKKMSPAKFPAHLFLEEVKHFPQIQPSNISVSFLDYPGYGEGQRNDQMARFIGKTLVRVHPSEWETVAWPMIEVANQKNTPPLTQRELRTTFDSVKRAEVRNSPYRWLKNDSGGGFSAPQGFSEQPQVLGELGDEIKHIAEVAESQKIDITETFPLQMPIFDEAIRGGVIQGDLVVVSGQTGQGKCLGAGTTVLMYDGIIKKVEEIKKGDFLMGPDSKKRKVLEINTGIDQMYEITPVKGGSYTVNSEHIISLKRTQTSLLNKGKLAKTRKGEIVNISVKEYLKKSNYFKHIHKGWRTGINWKEKKVTIDPYFLGLWLGDGNSSNLCITNPDKEIIQYIKKIGEENSLVVRNIEKRIGFCPRYSITKGTKKGEKIHNLLKNFYDYKLIPNKFVPDVYKINSYKIRSQILAGLIDSDGYLFNNCYEIITKYSHLRDDILFLARSLGLAAYSSKKIGKIKSINFRGEYHKIIISGETNKIPTKVTRKKATKRLQKKDVLVTGINLQQKEVGTYYGFELDKDGLFLFGDFTVTHNSSLCQDWTMSLIRGPQKAKVLWFSYELMVSEIWRKFQEMGATKEDLVFAPAKHSTGNLDWVEKKIKEAKEKFGIKAVVIDHLGFLLPKIKKGMPEKSMSSNYATYLTQIVREIKTIALQEEIIIFLPVHMRKVEHKNSGVDLEDIRDTSGVGQEADLVFLIERERNHNKDADSYFTDLTKIYLAKNRRTGITKIGRFTMMNGRFVQDTTDKEFKMINETSTIKKEEEKKVEIVQKEIPIPYYNQDVLKDEDEITTADIDKAWDGL